MQPSASTYLGFDFGMKRIGVAVGQTLSKTATPLDIIPAKDGIPNWSNIGDLIAEWDVQAIVVGIPLNMDGSEQMITHAAKRFANRLHERFKKPVHRVDERLSTVAVRQQLFEEGGYRAIKKAAIDSLAAQLLLENWMRHHE